MGKARSGATADLRTIPPLPLEPSDPQYPLYQRLKSELQSDLALNHEVMREEIRLEVEMRLSEFIKLLYQEIAIREKKNKLLEAEIAALKAKYEGR